MRKLVVAVGFAVATLAAGCMSGDAPPADDTGGDDGGDDQPPVGDGDGAKAFVEAFAQGECSAAHACEAEFPADAGITFEQAFGATIAECVVMAYDYYQPSVVRDAVFDGRITYDGAAAQACIQGLNFGTCTQYFNGTSPLPAACSQALIGNIPDGGACAVDLECASIDSWCGDGGACEPVPDV